MASASLPINRERPLRPQTRPETADEWAEASSSASASSLDDWIFSRVIAYESSHLGLWPEEEHETDLEPCYIQVVEKLRNGAGVECWPGLHLDDHLLLNDQIGAIASNRLPEMKKVEGYFALDAQSRVSQLDCEDSPIDGFQKPEAEAVERTVEPRDDVSRKL